MCVECQLDEMECTGPALPHFRKMATKLCITQLMAKKETTARNNLAFERVISQFMSEMLKDGGTMAEPGESAASTALLVWWIVDSGRGSQLGGMIIKMTAYFN